MLALTATASTDVFKAVKKRLSLENPLMIGTPLDRENIKYNLESHGRIDRAFFQIPQSYFLIDLYIDVHSVAVLQNIKVLGNSERKSDNLVTKNVNPSV